MSNQDPTIEEIIQADTKEIFKKAADGTQYSSLEYVKRFSMCDCITIAFPDTYTAMGAGLEIFIHRFEPGKKFIMPFANKLTPNKLKIMRPVGYKIPKNIDTFLWSPFHEATCQWFDLGDDIRYGMRLIGGFLVQYGVAKHVNPPTDEELVGQMHAMEQKVNTIWPNAKKIMVLYDRSPARVNNTAFLKKVNHFHELAFETLDWPRVHITLGSKDAKAFRPGNGFDENGIMWDGWDHYTDEARKNLFNKVLEAENGGQSA